MIEVELIEVEELEIGLAEGVITIDEPLPNYEGEYQITPKITEQVLETKNKTMLNDVTVFQIPYASVSNPSGGNTVTIGLE